MKRPKRPDLRDTSIIVRPFDKESIFKKKGNRNVLFSHLVRDGVVLLALSAKEVFSLVVSHFILKLLALVFVMQQLFARTKSFPLKI